MSRLIVKNIPAYLTQQQLREHFESKDGPGGTLTDVKVVLKPDGSSRRFGFIGFKTDIEAQKAQRWFDKTFVHSSRINVTIIDVSILRHTYALRYCLTMCRGQRTLPRQYQTSVLALMLLRLKIYPKSMRSLRKTRDRSRAMRSWKSSCRLCRTRKGLRGRMSTRCL